MTVRLSVLGPLRAEVDGTRVDLGTRGRRAVLARLAVAGGEVVPVDVLVHDLWHGEPPPRAVAALQVHVSHLRRVLEPARRPRSPASVLVSLPPGYALVLPVDALDASRFTALLDAVRDLPADRADAVLGEALGLWAGPAFAEFAHEPWAVAEVARLTELRLTATEQRARARIDAGAPARAVAELEQLCRDHPLREDAAALLATALFRTGRQADALALLARVRRTLADELGVDPGPAVRAAERDVLAHAPFPAPAPPPAPVLVGRDAELDRLRAAAEEACGPRIVLVSAAAGGGKTTLVDAFRADRQAAGWAVATGHCPEVDGVPPGWAWREAVEELLATHPGADAAALAPLRSAVGPATPEETFWTAQALVTLLRGIPAPLLLVLDDLHRAEDVTLRLLRTAVDGLAGAPVLVVATLRPDETGPDVTAALAALAGAVRDRIALPGLVADDVRVLLARHGVPVARPSTITRIAERTGGNPLFVRELARLVAVEGEDAADAVPDGVRDVLRRRLGRLPAAARTVLRHAAVLGRDVDVDAVLRMADLTEDAVLDALELGVVGGLLVEPAPGRLRFAHALVRDTLHGDVPPLRRARMHAAAVDVLAGADPATVAAHAVAAGPALPAARTMPLVTAAARSAVSFGAHREAVRWWSAAIDLMGRAGASPAEDSELRCAHVSALLHAGDVRGALVARDAAIAQSRGTPHLRAALTSLDAPTTWTIRPDAVIDATRVALLEQELDRATELAVRVPLLAVLVLETETADDARAHAAADEALDLSAGLADDVLRCRTLNAAGFVVNGPDRRAELELVGRALLGRATAARLPGFQAVGHHLLFMDAAGRLDLGTAQAHADAARTVAPGGQLAPVLGWSSLLTGLRALVGGDLDGATAAYAPVTAAMTAGGASNGAMMDLMCRYAVAHAAGRHGELADELLGHVPAAPPPFRDLVAAACVAAGRRATAAALWLPDAPQPRTYYWHLFTALRAETAIALGVREVAARCREELRPWAGTLAGVSSGSVTLGPVDTVLAELAAFLGRPEAEVAAHRAAAVALARRCGSAHWEHRALTRTAPAHGGGNAARAPTGGR